MFKVLSFDADMVKENTVFMNLKLMIQTIVKVFLKTTLTVFQAVSLCIRHLQQLLLHAPSAGTKYYIISHYENKLNCKTGI